MPPLVRLEDICKEFVDGRNRVAALQGVTLSIEPGEMVAVTGPSGSGKSTLLHVLGCLDRPSQGTYRFDGQSVAGLSGDGLAGLRNRRIAFVFQAFNLLPRASARENVELPLVYAGLERRQRMARADDALRQVGLAGRAEHSAVQLSGGEQQRVAIARALAMRADLLLADEPTGSLDSASGARILDVFRQINARGVTVILVTHDRRVAHSAHRIIGMRDGRLVSDSVGRTQAPA